MLEGKTEKIKLSKNLCLEFFFIYRDLEFNSRLHQNPLGVLV